MTPFLGIRCRSRTRGFSLVELVIVCACILILTAMIVPVTRFGMVRQKEMEMREALRSMRSAIFSCATSRAGIRGSAMLLSVPIKLISTNTSRNSRVNFLPSRTNLSILPR